MSVETLSSFPSKIVAGDTIRVEISDGAYPASAWDLVVVLSGRTPASFETSEDGDDFILAISSEQSAKLTPGSYGLVYLFTETATDERASVSKGSVQVTPDPLKGEQPSIARQTLEQMQDALFRLSKGTLQEANFNGQSFTKKNLKDLQDAIDRQKDIVSGEDDQAALAAGETKSSNLYVEFGR